MTPTKRSTKDIHPETREVIHNVINFFQSEKDCIGYLFNVQQVDNLAAVATGYNEHSISQIRQEGHKTNNIGSIIASKQKTHLVKLLDCSQLLSIQNIIYNIYTEREQAATLNTILLSVKDQLHLDISKEFLKNILMKKLGYKYKRCQNKLYFIESHDMRLERAKYLYRIQQNSALGPDAKTVVYLDEIWLYLLSMTTENNREQEPIDRLFVVMNGGGRMALIPEAKITCLTKLNTNKSFTEMDAEIFTKWLDTNLIPYLPDNVIVVLGNSPVESMQINKPPSFTSKREDLEQWLQQNKVPFDSNMLKIQLHELIQLNSTKIYVIDEVLKENGHEVMHLPRCNYDLNPIEYMCNIFKKKLSDIDTNNSEAELQKLTADAIDSVKNTDWIGDLAHVKRLEEEYWQKERQTENMTERLMILVGEDRFDSDSDDEDPDRRP